MGFGSAGGAVHGDGGAALVEVLAAEEQEGFALLLRQIAQCADEGDVLCAGFGEDLDEAILAGFGSEADVLAGGEDDVMEEPVGGFGFVRPEADRFETLAADGADGGFAALFAAADGHRDAANARVVVRAG